LKVLFSSETAQLLLLMW